MAAKFEIEKFSGNNFSSWKLKMKAILRKDKCLAAIGERPAEIVIVAMAAKFEIEKFSGNNFSSWKLKMKAILRKDKCLAAIGERPAEVTDDSKWDEMYENVIANLHLALSIQLDEFKLRCYLLKVPKALLCEPLLRTNDVDRSIRVFNPRPVTTLGYLSAVIFWECDTLANEVLSSIKEKKSAKDMWDHLARLYEARSLHNKIFIKRNGNGYSRNRQKQSKKQQNQTQSGKDQKRQSQSKPEVKSQSPWSTKVNSEKSKSTPGKSKSTPTKPKQKNEENIIEGPKIHVSLSEPSWLYYLTSGVFGIRAFTGNQLSTYLGKAWHALLSNGSVVALHLPLDCRRRVLRNLDFGWRSCSLPLIWVK
nr:Gag-Pol polyprotein [Tanacetum cinerariifolium]